MNNKQNLGIHEDRYKLAVFRTKELINKAQTEPVYKVALLVELGLLYNFGQEYPQAITSFDKALKIQPDLHKAWYNRGCALEKLGRIKEAVTSYDKALALKPDDEESWKNRAVSLRNLGRWEDSIASLNEVLKINPDHGEVWNDRGNSELYLDRWEDALASFDKALEIKPNIYEIWNNRGVALYNLDRFQDAIASYDKALALKPDLDQALYMKACCYALKGDDADLCIQNLQQAMKLNPDKYLEILKTDSMFDSIRSHSHFQALIQE
jgi:tetratricopeptide (TPR) repeat protein